jgi:hypothetical protein
MTDDDKGKKGLGPPLYTSYVFQFDPTDTGLGGDPGGRVSTVGGPPVPGGPIFVVYTWPFKQEIMDLNNPNPNPPSPGG